MAGARQQIRARRRRVGPLWDATAYFLATGVPLVLFVDVICAFARGYPSRHTAELPIVFGLANVVLPLHISAPGVAFPGYTLLSDATHSPGADGDLWIVGLIVSGHHPGGS